MAFRRNTPNGFKKLPFVLSLLKDLIRGSLVFVSSPINLHMTETDSMTDLESLRNQLRTFAADRDWDQFHSPKNLAAALAVEAAELLEHFQWLTEAESQQLPPQALVAVRAEVADVLLYLIRISDKLGINLIAAAKAKMVLNAVKYPVEKARGNSKKYTEL